MLLLLKLRTSGCVIVGALCVVLSVFEPVRWLPWDMLAAVVVCIVAVRFVLRQRMAAALAVPVEEEQEANDYDDDDYYDALILALAEYKSRRG